MSFHPNPNGNPFMMKLARRLMRLFGWQVTGKFPDVMKLVVIVAPHTSGWDLVVGIGLASALGARVRWLAKHTLFQPPLGWLLRPLGGIPVDRRSPHNIVDQMAQHFKRLESLFLCLTPEGTRKRVNYWKSGFYHIARKAQVPVALAFFDYKNKICGLGPTFIPSGDIQADLEMIREFYANMTGKIPHQFGEIQLQDRMQDGHA